MRPLPALVALTVLVAGLSIVPAPAAAQSTVDLLENFQEEDTAASAGQADLYLDPPNGDWYTHGASGTGDFGTTNIGAAGTSQSWVKKVTAGSGQGSTYLTLSGGGSVCNADRITFYFRVASVATSQEAWIGFQSTIGNGGGSPGFGIRLGSANVVATTYGSSSSEVALAGISANTWYQMDIRDINCGAAKARFVFQGSSTTVDAPGSISSITRIQQTFENGGITATDTWVDQIVLYGMPVPEGPGPAPTPNVDGTTSVAVDSLQGFTVDATGTTIMTRQHGSRDAVVSYDASTLDELGFDGDLFCNMSNGVATYEDAVFYAKCGAGGTGVDVISVRNRFFGAHTGSGGLCNADYDETDDGGGNQIDIPNNLNDLHTLDFYFTTTDGISCTSAWVYSRTNGQLGVVAFTRNSGFVNDRWVSKDVTFSSQAPDDSCFWRATDGRDYFGAVSEVSGTSVYEVKVDVVPWGDVWQPQVTMDRVYHSAGTLSNSVAIDCARGVAAILGADGVARVVQVVPEGATSVGSIIFTASGAVAYGGAALSTDAKWMAHHKGSGVFNIVCVQTCGDNRTAGDVVAEITQPATGDFRGIDLDKIGTAGWLATTDTIERFIIQEFTCGDSCQDINVDGAGRTIDTSGSGGSGGSGGSPALEEQGIFGGLVSGSVIMFGPVGGPFFASTLMIIGFASIGAGIGAGSVRLTDRASASLGMMLGAGLGFGFSVITGLFPKEWAFIGVLVALVGTVIIKALSGGEK